MPKEDTTLVNSPFWRMSAYREWSARRPGHGVGGGRPKGSGKPLAAPRARRTMKIPGACPHCSKKIRATDLPAREDGKPVRSMALPGDCPHCRKQITPGDLPPAPQEAVKAARQQQPELREAVVRRVEPAKGQPGGQE